MAMGHTLAQAIAFLRLECSYGRIGPARDWGVVAAVHPWREGRPLFR
jgi:hypothetical protein